MKKRINMRTKTTKFRRALCAVVSLLMVIGLLSVMPLSTAANQIASDVTISNLKITREGGSIGSSPVFSGGTYRLELDWALDDTNVTVSNGHYFIIPITFTNPTRIMVGASLEFLGTLKTNRPSAPFEPAGTTGTAGTLAVTPKTPVSGVDFYTEYELRVTFNDFLRDMAELDGHIWFNFIYSPSPAAAGEDETWTIGEHTIVGELAPPQ